MPDISKIQLPLHDPNSPYHWHFDNLPLQSLLQIIELLNAAIDNANEILREAQGTQGTLSNRLGQSTDENGNLLVSAIDESLHNIGAHQDGSYLGVDYVRMTLDERTKLDSLDENATSLYLNIPTNSGNTDFSNGKLILQDSSTVSWTLNSPNILTANLAFGVEAAHRHYYDIQPNSSNYINFTTPYPFIEDSLRVYINGIRVGSDEVYVPSYLISNPWTLISVTVDDPALGTFHLSSGISENDVIKVDFEISLV